MKHYTGKGWFKYLLLFIGIFCIAWSAIFVKLANVSGLGSGFYRLFFGTLGILIIWLIRRKRVTDIRSVGIAILCGIFFGCDIALWNTSIMLSKASISTLLANLAPVWVGLGALLFLREKPKLIFWIGTLVAIIGVVVIVGIDKVYHSKLSIGNLLAIAASFFYAAYLLTTRRGRVSLDTISFTGISMISSTLVLLLFCILFKTPLWGYQPQSWLSLIGLGLISQLGGWLAINFALGYIKPTIASVSLLSQSVITALIAIPVLGEYLSALELSGAIIVLFGIYLVNRKMQKTPTLIDPEY